MSRQPYQIGLLADFNAHNLAVLLQKSPPPGAKCVEAPYGQTTRLLLDGQAEFWSEPLDALMVWALPHLVAPEFQRVLACGKFSMSNLLAEVDLFGAQIRRVPEKVRTIIVPSLLSPGVQRGLGPLDLMNNVGVANSLIRMNLRLAEHFESDQRVVFLDV